MTRPGSTPFSGFLKYAAIWAVLFASYWLTGKIGLRLALVDGTASLIWPATGLAVGMVYRFGLSYCSAVLAAAFFLNQGVQQWPVALGIAMGNTAAVFLCVAGLRRIGFEPRFEQWNDCQKLIAMALLGMAVSAANGSIWLIGAGRIPVERLAHAFLVWLGGDLAGVLLMAPLILAAPATWPAWRRELTASGMAVSTLTILILSAVVFFDFAQLGPWSLAAVFLPFILTIRSAVVLGAWPGAFHLFLMTSFSLVALSARTGPAQQILPPAQSFAAWGYLASASVAVLLAAGMLGEREAALRRIRHAEASFRTLIEDNPACIVRFRHDGRLLFANETFRRSFSVDPGMSQGIDFLEVTGLSAVPEFVDSLQSEREHSAAVSAVCRILLDGNERWFRWTARIVKESSGMGVEFHAVGLDVTEQVQAETRRQQVVTQAIHAQKLESVGALAGGIAHEFNNLLAAVLGNAEMAQMTLPPESEAQTYLGHGMQAARRAAELTRQLLDYSARTRVESMPADLSEIVQGMRDLIGVAVPRRCLLTYELAEGLPLVLAEESRLRQLVMSLAANAGEAAAEAGGSVVIRTKFVFFRSNEWIREGTMKPGHAVLLQVEDTGPGMPPGVKARVFEPFFTTKFPGRGLGLAAALAIVREHRGAVGVCSRPGLGTCISILLPLIDQAVLPNAVPFHDSGCDFCETRHDFETPPEHGVPMPPAPYEIPRTGFSSHTRPRSRSLTLQLH